MNEWTTAIRRLGRFVAAGVTGNWAECRRLADEGAATAGEMNNERGQWLDACTLDELGELMAWWLEGSLRTRPGYYGSTDLDTPELTTLCAESCRAGFVTTDSQRAVLRVNEDGAAVRSRAMISGFCDNNTAARIHAAARETGVSVLALRGDPGMASSVVVTEVNGEPYYLAGGYPGYDDLIAGWADVWHRKDAPGLRPGINRRAFRAIRSAWYVSIVDPEWGRNDRLTATLARVGKHD